MSFINLLTRRQVVMDQVQLLANDYKNKKKGRIYNERLRILTNRAKDLQFNIDIHGNGFIYLYKGKVCFKKDDCIEFTKSFEISLQEGDLKEVRALIEYRIGGEVLSIKRSGKQLGRLTIKD